MDFLESLSHHLLLLMRLDSLYPRIKQEMLFNSEIVPQDVKLWTDTNLQLNNFQLSLYAEASDPCVSTCELVHANQLRDESSFSSTVWSKKSEELSIVNFDGNVLVGDLWWPSIDSRVNFSHIFGHQGIVVIIRWPELVDGISLALGIGILIQELVVIPERNEMAIVSINLLVQVW